MKTKKIFKLLLVVLLVCNINMQALVKPKNTKAVSIEEVAIADRLYAQQKYAQALKHYTNVANKSKNADPLSLLLAQANLANMNYNGLGTPVNYKQALKYSIDVFDNKLSTPQALSEAASRIANIYMLGLGVKANYALALKYLRAVINNPSPNPLALAIAQVNLGSMYDNGAGVKKSRNTAETYYNKAFNGFTAIINDPKNSDPNVISKANYFIDLLKKILIKKIDEPLKLN